jgi:hypothetical protein
VSIAPVTNDFWTQKEALSSAEYLTYYTDWDILTMVPAVPLVFQPTDTASAGKDDDSSSSGKGEDDDDNAATTGLSGPGLVQLSMVLVSMCVGAGLLVAW